jgi:hypothetical protein
MVTLSDIDTILRNIATHHNQIRAFYTTALDELDIDKITIDMYPLFYAQCTRISTSENAETFTYEFVVADLVIEEQQGVDLIEVYSETHLIMRDIIAQFNLAASVSGQFVPGKWVVGFPLNLNPFTARFNNMLTGWGCEVDISVPNPLDLCNALY